MRLGISRQVGGAVADCGVAGAWLRIAVAERKATVAAVAGRGGRWLRQVAGVESGGGERESRPDRGGKFKNERGQ